VIQVIDDFQNGQQGDFISSTTAWGGLFHQTYFFIQDLRDHNASNANKPFCGGSFGDSSSVKLIVVRQSDICLC